jgi:hypothetical protein
MVIFIKRNFGEKEKGSGDVFCLLNHSSSLVGAKQLLVR